MQAQFVDLSSYALEYREADRVRKSVLLDDVIAVTGWSRDHARRSLTHYDLRATSDRKRGRPQGSIKYSKSAVDALEQLWSVSGYLSGKYLAVAMPKLLDRLTSTGELSATYPNSSVGVRAELTQMSAATIDRYLRLFRETRDALSTDEGRTAIPRFPIRVRTAAADAAAAPGSYSVDVITHKAVRTAGSEFYSFRMIDPVTEWMMIRTASNNTPANVYGILEQFRLASPVPITELGFDSGRGHLNWAVGAWCREKNVTITRGQPGPSSHSKALARQRRARIDGGNSESEEEVRLFNMHWDHITVRHNFLVPGAQAQGWIGWGPARIRRYSGLCTPLVRLLATGVLSVEDESALREADAAINPAEIAYELRELSLAMTGRPRATGRQLSASMVRHAG